MPMQLDQQRSKSRRITTRRRTGLAFARKEQPSARGGPLHRQPTDSGNGGSPASASERGWTALKGAPGSHHWSGTPIRHPPKEEPTTAPPPGTHTPPPQQQRRHTDYSVNKKMTGEEPMAREVQQSFALGGLLRATRCPPLSATSPGAAKKLGTL
ncbi:hypothetical protein HPB50_005118 [Hyalomma asiaticum]|uniref:Uncharacterized protein n=1 Tax=Hyalomma asiaticum TaxID=266040 RepID=A0ACB7TD82_HYAAI|nr:hypothetical protein HPB50_005118 [Hyalomma asiaticum]